MEKVNKKMTVRYLDDIRNNPGEYNNSGGL